MTLACLKRMVVLGGGPPSLLLDHLSVPVDARFTAQVDSRGVIHLPVSFDCFGQLSKFSIRMYVRGFYPRIQFRGPNWEISMVPTAPPTTSTTTCRVLESFAQFYPLKIERVRISGGDLMVNGGCDIYRVLAPMVYLRTLTISGCKNLSSFVRFMDEPGLCHKLEECVLDPRGDEEKFDIQNVIRLGVARRTELKSVRIVSRDELVQAGVSKLEEYVPHVECSPRVALAINDVGSGDEEE